MATIQGVYVALFGRPADPTGLAYFNSVTNNGANLSAINNLAGQPEYTARFSGMSNLQIINSIYQSLFDRDADLTGLNFFADALAKGTLNINNIAIAILDGAQGSDKTIVENKVAAANLYTAALDTGSEVVAYTGLEAAAQGRAFIDGVTTTVPTQAAVDAAVAAMVTEVNNGAPGQTFVLTDAIGESVMGTAGTDTFRAVVDGAVGGTSTLNTSDSIDGGAGVDTLNLTIVGAATGLATGVSIKNVEIVNLDASGNTVALTGLETGAFVGATQVWQIGEAGSIEVSTSDVTAGFRNADASVTVTAADGVNAVSVALDRVDTASALVIAETTADDVATATVSGSVAGAGALSLDVSGPSALETLNLGITSDSTVTFTASTTVTTLDASKSTGDLTIDLAGFTAIEKATFGSGNDTVTAAVVEQDAMFNLGAGNDALTFDATAAGTANHMSTISLGTGGDTLTFSAIANLQTVSASTIEKGLVVVSDFNASEDVIDLGGVAGARTTQNTVNAAVSGAASLHDAAEAAATVVATGDFALFNYGGNAYLFVNNNTAALDSGDGLVELVGVNVSNLTSANFVI